MSLIHTTKDGTEIELENMSDSHLLNTIAYFERKAKEGIKVEYGCSGSVADDMYYDEDFFTGEEARIRLRIDEYIQEAKRRGLVK